MRYKKPVLWAGCIVAAMVIVFAIGMLSNPLEARKPEGQYEGLRKQRTAYIGNGGRVSLVSAGLDYPEPFKYDHIELQTNSRPYRLTVFLAMDEAVAGKQAVSTALLAQSSPDFNKNALLLFGLIGNADEVTFQLQGEPGISSALYTREWAQARTNSPLYESTGTVEGFLALVNSADEWISNDRIVQIVEAFGQNMKNVRTVNVPEK